MSRQDFRGAAAKCTATGAVGLADATIALTGDTSGWPTGAGGRNFVAEIDRGVAGKTEKILCSALSAGTLTITTRGYDNTTAVTHTAGATVEHCISAAVFDDLSAHMYDVARNDHSQYFLKGTDHIAAADISAGAVTLAKFGTGLQPVQVCTSSTRPGSPTVGTTIYETDTGKILEYQGATDTWTPLWNTAWGIVPGGTGTTAIDSSAFAAATDMAGLTATWTTVANRRYEYTATVWMQAATADNNVQLFLTDGSNASKGYGTNARKVFHLTTEIESISFTGYEDGIASGSVTRKVRAQSVTGGNFTAKNATVASIFTVKDIGPNGVPS